MGWLQTLIAAVVGAVLAWGVGELNRRSARKDEWAKIRRAKLEQTFAEIAGAESQGLQLMISAIQRAEGLEPTSTAPLDLSRLSALLSLYFPESKPVVDAHQGRLDALRNERFKAFRDAAEKQDAEGIKSAGVILAIAMNDEVSRFARELRPILKEAATALAVRN